MATNDLNLPAGLSVNGGSSFGAYVEGSWTPLFGGFSTFGTYTTTITGNKYVRSGRMVHLYANIEVTAIPSAGTGLLQIAGVPFDKAAAEAPVGSVIMSNVDIQAGTMGLAVGFGSVTAASSTLFIAQMQDNATLVNLPVTAIAVGSVIRLSITYFV